jgi:hypothetical protein
MSARAFQCVLPRCKARLGNPWAALEQPYTLANRGFGYSRYGNAPLTQVAGHDLAGFTGYKYVTSLNVGAGSGNWNSSVYTIIAGGEPGPASTPE